MTPIAHFRSPFSSKFGIPKQSGLVEELEGEIVLEPEYRDENALRGLEAFDYLWIIWQFSANKHEHTSPTVRPPLLGGNVRMGVFATRSPFRPNGLGLSSVRIKKIDFKRCAIRVLGADLMDGTPIFDIKPYVTYTDCHPQARSGFADAHPIIRLEVEIPTCVASLLGPERTEVLRKTLELDPRPRYHSDANKTYGMFFHDINIKFKVCNGKVEVIAPSATPLSSFQRGKKQTEI